MAAISNQFRADGAPTVAGVASRAKPFPYDNPFVQKIRILTSSALVYVLLDVPILGVERVTATLLLNSIGFFELTIGNIYVTYCS
jgi:hypothetical protein